MHTNFYTHALEHLTHTHTHVHAHTHRLCYCFENMIVVTDGVGRGEGCSRGECQGSSIVPNQCESVSIAIETGATLGRHAFISAPGSPLAIRGQINPPGCSEDGGVGLVGLCGHTHTCTHARAHAQCLTGLVDPLQWIGTVDDHLSVNTLNSFQNKIHFHTG